MPLPSYVSGVSTIPLLGETIGEHFCRAAARWPRREALVVRHQNIRWTYEALRQRVDELSAGLRSLGLEPGDRIGIWAPNCAEWVLTQFASARAGLILVTINPAYRVSELEYALRKSGCKALVLAPEFKSSDYIAMLRTLVPELARAQRGQLRAARLPALRQVIHLGEGSEPGMLRFSDVQRAGGSAHRTRLETLSRQLQLTIPSTSSSPAEPQARPKGPRSRTTTS